MMVEDGEGKVCCACNRRIIKPHPQYIPVTLYSLNEGEHDGYICSLCYAYLPESIRFYINNLSKNGKVDDPDVEYTSLIVSAFRNNQEDGRRKDLNKWWTLLLSGRRPVFERYRNRAVTAERIMMALRQEIRVDSVYDKGVRLSTDEVESLLSEYALENNLIG